MTHSSKPHDPATAPPRAPIVWNSDRLPLSAIALATIGPSFGSAKRRDEIAAALWAGERPPRPPGQLWQRLAEREVATFGEPYPLWPEHGRREGVIRRDPVLARLLTDRNIEARRPAMRAAALVRKRPDGAMLYRMSLDNPGRVELNS